MKGKPNIIKILSKKEMISNNLIILHTITNYQNDGYMISGFNVNEFENGKSELVIKFTKKVIK